MIDTSIKAFLSAIRNLSGVEIFFAITLFGEVFAIVFFAILASLFLWRKRLKKEIIALWAAVIGSSATTYLLKIIIDRPRPEGGVLLEETASFPSGHATIAVAFYGFLTYLLLNNIKNIRPRQKYRVPIILAGAILIFLIGFSRLYLGVHYLSDVLAGYLVGFSWFVISVKIIKKF